MFFQYQNDQFVNFNWEKKVIRCIFKILKADHVRSRSALRILNIGYIELLSFPNLSVVVIVYVNEYIYIFQLH